MVRTNCRPASRSKSAGGPGKVEDLLWTALSGRRRRVLSVRISITEHVSVQFRVTQAKDVSQRWSLRMQSADLNAEATVSMPDGCSACWISQIGRKVE